MACPVMGKGHWPTWNDDLGVTRCDHWLASLGLLGTMQVGNAWPHPVIMSHDEPMNDVRTRQLHIWRSRGDQVQIVGRVAVVLVALALPA